jgi:uncharacterized membrane protein YhaH (DUF805 family)
MTGKRLHDITLSVVLVLATIATGAGIFAHDEWMQRLGVVLLVTVGLIALTDWVRTRVN